MRTPSGPAKSVLIREVSLFQGLNYTHLYCVGTRKCVLIREVSLFQGLNYTHLYCVWTSEKCPD